MSVETKPVLQVELGELYLTIDEKKPNCSSSEIDPTSRYMV